MTKIGKNLKNGIKKEHGKKKQEKDIPILIQQELDKEENNTFNIKLRKFYRK